jgi:hypothetical protein
MSGFHRLRGAFPSLASLLVRSLASSLVGPKLSTLCLAGPPVSMTRQSYNPSCKSTIIARNILALFSRSKAVNQNLVNVSIPSSFGDTTKAFRYPPTMATTRKRHPLPWWLITDAPALAVATGPVYRAVWQLAVAYWQAGCQPLPPDATSLAAICRIPTPHWRIIETPVSQVIADISAAMDTEHARVVARWKAQSAGSAYATHRSLIKHAEKRLAQATQTPEVLPARDTAPIPVVIASQQTHERKGLSDTPKQRSKPSQTPQKPADPGFTD